MPLLVEPRLRFHVGKFGGSFVDIHRTYEPQSESSDNTPYLRENNSAFGQSLVFGVEGQYPCLPSFRQKPQNRPYYSIENGTDIPTQDCNGIDGFRKMVTRYLKPINEEDDPFLNTNPDSNGDIMNSDYAGNRYTSTGNISPNSWSVVSGIEFSLSPDIHENFNPSHRDEMKVYWAFSVSGINKPSIVTDNRNQQYLNVANLKKKSTFYWAGNRIYLEIEHGFNSMEYSYIITNLDGWIETKKKNSLIISRFISGNDDGIFRNAGGFYSLGPKSSPMLPRGRCQVMFLKET